VAIGKFGVASRASEASYAGLAETPFSLVRQLSANPGRRRVHAKSVCALSRAGLDDIELGITVELHPVSPWDWVGFDTPPSREDRMNNILRLST
jgi:hypothetical protein